MPSTVAPISVLTQASLSPDSTSRTLTTALVAALDDLTPDDIGGIIVIRARYLDLPPAVLKALLANELTTLQDKLYTQLGASISPVDPILPAPALIP